MLSSVGFPALEPAAPVVTEKVWFNFETDRVHQPRTIPTPNASIVKMRTAVGRDSIWR